MVSVTHSIAMQDTPEQSILLLEEGLSPEERARIRLAVDFATPLYAGRQLKSGEELWSHALGMALILAGLKQDTDCRLAALFFAVPSYDDQGIARIEERFGVTVARLVKGFFNLRRLTPELRSLQRQGTEQNEDQDVVQVKAQTEILRKMLLAMVEDIRVVLLRLSSRTQTLRYLAKHPDEKRSMLAREALEIYSPLANRLGVWELKWEMEDLSFRFLYPDLYKKIASQLDEKRVERALFIKEAIERIKHELESLGVLNAQVSGRPKHIYSIWNKMRKKELDFSEVYDVRAIRVIVDEIKDCYAALSIVHNIWPPIPNTFDDYISNPKGNNYRSLHVAVRCPDDKPLEVQIRTHEMHRHAELGIAAHWRYKEGSKSGADNRYDEKIAWLRQLLAWKNEVADSQEWGGNHYKVASLDETIYVLTPQGRVIDLPHGATPLDFAYRVHTDLGHRCRGAKVDGMLVTLNTPLQMGQRIEIISAKQGGPSRDWLNPSLNFLVTHRARAKVRQWFSSLALEESIADGRAIVNRELQRLGETGMRIEELASRLGYSKNEELYVSVARAELGMRQLQIAIKGSDEPLEDKLAFEAPVSRHHASDKSDKGILIVGIDKLLTQLAGCCKPAPPDAIIGFVTRGKGVSIHRADCTNFAHMKETQPERVIETAWSGDSANAGIFAIDIVVDAHDRQGLLRDISEVLTRERINVIAASTQSKQGMAYMRFTAEIQHLDQLKQTFLQIHQIKDVISVRRV